MGHKEMLQKVVWRDLVPQSPLAVLSENCITLPWLGLSLVLAYYGLYGPSLLCSAFFFLTGLRQVHNGFHNALGTNHFLTWLTLYVNSILMISSIHAIKWNHLRHHRLNLTENDYEGKAAFMKWYGALLYGPRHVYLIHKIALQKGSKTYRERILLELTSILIFCSLVFYFDITFLKYHIGVMLLGELLSAFFAVWSVHQGCDEHTIARTQRTWWKNRLTYNMYYHLEHHLFPAVPTTRLDELAQRIDDSLPDLIKKKAF